MTLTIDLTPAEEIRLEAVARQEGMEPAEFIKRLITECLSRSASDEEDPILALYAKWDEQDAQMTPEEIAEENRQWEEFKTNINAERDRARARWVF